MVNPDTNVGSVHSNRPVRADLHCHSEASNKASEAMLNAIGCPESYSKPTEVYAQARRREMDFVTITDHDSIEGVMRLVAKPDVLVGEELTCYFPEDQCKIHLLVWGLGAADHVDLQRAASNIYLVAELIEKRNLAHSVAHPVYRQNDRLERWHLERLILMFKGFETLNGSHSVLHRQSLEPMLDSLTPAIVCELAAAHRIPPRWPQPHVKSRTGGSDDHGLFNIGRTWTEFPAGVTSIDQVLHCLRTAKTSPGGEAGSSLKLAHNFYGVGIRYYQQRLQQNGRAGSTQGLMLKSLVGSSMMIRRRDVMRAFVKSKVRSIGRRFITPFRPKARATGTELLLELFSNSSRRRLREHLPIMDAIRQGHAALGEHEAMFNFMSTINRDVAGGIAESVMDGLQHGQVTALFDAVSSVAAHQFFMLPYYFALFHQNRERSVLARITGNALPIDRQTMKVGVFTDSYDEVNGVCRFIQDMGTEAAEMGRSMMVGTCTTNPKFASPLRQNFTPLLDRPTPFYPEQPLTVPPFTEVLEWADRQQFDVIHVHTPGPMGICGWLVAKMLRVPLVGTYHTDFPQYVHRLTRDHRLTTGTAGYMRWFYGQAAMTLVRSREYQEKLVELGLPKERLAMTSAGVDARKFTPALRDSSIWATVDVPQPLRLLYVGRVSIEKNLPFLCESFKQLCQRRGDVALVIVGDGPYRLEMERATAGLPVKFLGYRGESTSPTLATLFASSDLFVFPSDTDTLGQVVIEAQASGLPVVVGDKGGPKEAMDDCITGIVVPTESPAVWTHAIDQLLTDFTRRHRMSRTGPQRMGRFGLRHMFEAFWEEHWKAMRVNQAVGHESHRPVSA